MSNNHARHSLGILGLTIGLLLGLSVGTARATLVAADSFLFGDPPVPAAGEYLASPTNDGRLHPPGGGTPQNPTVPGFTGPWDNTTGGGTSLWQVVETPLDHPAVSHEAGGSVRFQFDTEVGLRTVARDLSSPPALSTGDEIWMSVLLRTEELDPDFDGFALAGFTEDANFNDDETDGFRVGVVGDGSEMDLVYRSRNRLVPPGGPVVVDDVVLLDGVAAGDTHLVLLKGVKNSVGGGGFPNDEISIWVDPTNVVSEAGLGAPTTVVNDFSLFTNSFQFLVFQGGNITGDGVLFDEPRLGTTLADVATANIPEPASAALGILAMAALTCSTTRRDKRRSRRRAVSGPLTRRDRQFQP